MDSFLSSMRTPTIQHPPTRMIQRQQRRCLKRVFTRILACVLLLVFCRGQDSKQQKQHPQLDAARRLIRALSQTKTEWKRDLSVLLEIDETELQSILDEQLATEKPTHNDNTVAADASQGNCPSPFATRLTADRHASGLLEAANDSDCFDYEFDASNSPGDIERARNVLIKCRILVIRNVFSENVTNRVLPAYKRYVEDIRSGAVSSEGTTSFGGDYFILKEDHSRFNYLATRDLIDQSTGVLDHPTILQLLEDPAVLGPEMILNHVGIIHAYPGAGAQYWHTDGPYVANEDGLQFETVGVGGHDVPPSAINLFMPLVPDELTVADGPTEFCIGTSWLRGHDYETDLPVWDQQLLRAKNGIVEQVQEFEWAVDHGMDYADCPKRLQRRPLLRKGDALLFDYQITHRGGANVGHNADGRSVIFAAYSRKWFKDDNFDKGDDDSEFDELTRRTRTAVVQRNE